MLIRLDKYLADMQVGTRSEVKELIRKKRVTVNDNIVSWKCARPTSARST